MEIRPRITDLALLLIIFGLLNLAAGKDIVCPVNSVKDFIFPPPKDVCSVLEGGAWFPYNKGVIEGDEDALLKALHMVYRNEHEYVALLFYASWCPFSASFKPSFSVLSSIFPSIPHFAVEESAIRPSILSKYGVHGFPALLLLNSTMRIPYQGSRTLDSLISFYADVTGIETAPTDEVYLEKVRCLGYDGKDKNNREACPFPWARSPENLLEQETYLALATLFVILRLIYFSFSTLRKYGELAWRRYVANLSLSSLWKTLLNRAIQLLKEPCKKSKLQGAKAWASKSLATVSFGDSSSTRDSSANSIH